MNAKNGDTAAHHPLLPFLKWPGGKRWLARTVIGSLPRSYNSYIEPFLGSASMFFALRPANAILSDTNAELIDAYRGLRNRTSAVVKQLHVHATRHSDDYFYEVRSSEPRTVVERAARMIYLNRTCFNGIYRVNLDGIFNVPRGTKDAVILESDDFEAIGRALRRAKLFVADFEEVIDRARKGDLVFADPPYTVHHNVNGFIKYNEKLFSWADQERLAATLARARSRGAYVMATNANHESVKALYNEYGFEHRAVSRFSSISASGSSRKQYEELIIRG